MSIDFRDGSNYTTTNGKDLELKIPHENTEKYLKCKNHPFEHL